MNTELVKSKIRSIPNFPKEGIVFRDVTTLLKDPEGLKIVIDEMTERYSNMQIDKIAGIESRGFILAGALAYNLGKGFIPIRKKGKLPHETISHEYELEYGTDIMEIHLDSVEKGDKILLIDDLLATGGTALGGAKLIEKLGGEVVEIGFIIDLPEVGGSSKIKEAGYNIYTMVEFEGE